MLFQAGIPPVEGMAILQSDAQSPEGKAIFEEILTVCRQGESFHKALEATKVFPDYCLHMIALGEESGNLDVCMSSLADYYEKEDAIAGSIRDAVTYPFIMIAMMAAVIVVLVSRVMPIFEQVYIELGSEMTGFAASLFASRQPSEPVFLYFRKYSVHIVVTVPFFLPEPRPANVSPPGS